MARSLARRAGTRGLEGATVLEIGGGVGQVLLELLTRGAAAGEVVELLPTYEEHVRALATERDLSERVSFRMADLVADPAATDPADIVVMNKVVCCTPDGIELTGIAAALARRTLVVSHPRDVWWVRAAFRLVNVYLGLRRRRFRVYVHAPHALEQAVRSAGLTRASQRDGPLFRIVAFERA